MAEFEEYEPSELDVDGQRIREGMLDKTAHLIVALTPDRDLFQARLAATLNFFRGNRGDELTLQDVDQIIYMEQPLFEFSHFIADERKN